MKKVLLPLLLASLSLLSLTSCNNNYYLEKPDNTNLEFWITQEVSLSDFEDHVFIPGCFGCSVYFGAGYDFVEEQYPEHYVTYTVSSYPDYSSGANAITSITVTDPKVTFYGLTIECTTEEFVTVMKDSGFKNAKCDGTTCGAGKNNAVFTLNLATGNLQISAYVSNKHGIIY